MTILSGHTYKIINVKGGTALDLSGADNASIIGYGFHDGGNQKWHLEWTGHHWTIRSLGTGLYLGVQEPVGDGAPLKAVPDAVNWDIWPDEKDQSVYRVFKPSTTFNIDLSDHGNSTPGTPITLWGKWEGKNQTWRFEESA